MQLDTVDANIKYIQSNYPKQTRLELIENLLDAESINSQEEQKKVETLHSLIDQIFSVVLKNLNWNIATSSNDWDYRPIDVMEKVFPNIDKTKWYDMRHKQVIDQLKGTI